jgi:glycosyltransferase involved in cell wall biosynthesis
VTPVRLLALLEANSVTGPSKNLFQFACCARSGQAGPPVEVAIALFRREGVENLCMEAARQAGPVYPITERSRFDFGVIPQLRSVIREFQPDVIQSHAIKSHLLIRAARFHATTPWIAFHHGYTWPDLRMRLYNQLDRWSLRGASLVLTVSAPFREELIGRGVARHRIEIVHNAIDPQWASRFRSPQAGRELRAALGIGPDDRVILIAGRLSREKDHEMAVRAVHRLLARGTVSHPSLLIVGDGPERKRLQATIASLDMGASVRFTGQVPSAEPYYGIADAAVLSSRSEGSPNALLEAMAARVPVVATAVGGVPEIVSHNESALLVRAGDCESMARALADILTNESLARRLADAAHARICASYTPAARTQRLSEIYARLAARDHFPAC